MPSVRPTRCPGEQEEEDLDYSEKNRPPPPMLSYSDVPITLDEQENRLVLNSCALLRVYFFAVNDNINRLVEHGETEYVDAERVLNRYYKSLNFLSPIDYVRVLEYQKKYAIGQIEINEEIIREKRAQGLVSTFDVGNAWGYGPACVTPYFHSEAEKRLREHIRQIRRMLIWVERMINKRVGGV